MATLIVETHARGVSHYHPVDTEAATIGRALNNDIILSDLSVSPQHLKIEREESGSFLVTNLSDENGTRINKQKLNVGEGRKIQLPTELWLGSSKIRLLDADMPVEATRVRECTGFFCLYTSPVWATVLLMAALGMFLFDQFMSTSMSRSIGHYVDASFTSMLYLLGFFLVVAGISRLAAHRWDIVPAISVASLLFLVPQVVEYAGHFVSYFFSSDSFRVISLNLVNFLLLPLLITLFMMRIAHSPLLSAAGVSLLVSAPFMAYQASDFVKELTRPDFSPLPTYDQNLSSLDFRQQNTIRISDFIQHAEEKLAQTVLTELDRKSTEVEK
ncbi:MAG: FHA domain-containing protein [Thiotrichaceae bacterium]